MKKYVEIKLRADPEFVPSMLMNALYAKLHKALVTLRSTDIGVSFPDAQTNQPTLGTHLRLHGTAESLKKLMGLDWLKGMHDHVTTSEPHSIPDKAGWCTVRRVQAKSSPERLRRRLAKRKNISLEEARKLIPAHCAKTLRLPFLRLNSRSTGHPFPLFINQQETESPMVAEFNHFGLSTKATVPWF